MTWWTGLQPRERLLIAIAATLTLLVVAWQFVLVPARTAQADAKAELAETSRTLNRLQEAYLQRRQAGDLAPVNAGQALSGDAFQAAVTRAATDKGLAIARLQNRGDEGLVIVLEAVDPRLAFLWLEEVESRFSGTIMRLNMDQAGDGTVRVSVDLQGGRG